MWSILLKPRAWIAKLLLSILVVGILCLGYFDYLHPIKAVLDSEILSFTLGKTRISAYIVIKATLTVVMFFWVTGILSEFGEQRIKALNNIKESNKALITKIFQIVLYFLSFVVGLNFLGLDLTAFAIFGGAIGIGVGFGLQKITSNFISGLILLFEKSVEHNDLVELSDGTSGFIRHTGARYTLIENVQGKEIMIPNEDFITSRVTNWTYSNSKGRVEIKVGVSYDSDIEKAMALVLEAAKEHPRCLSIPEPNCFLREFADSSVNLLLFFWVADVTEGRYGPQSDVMLSIWKKFKANNIVIPYPQREVHTKHAV
jgi:small-conductance mechanosensitive channel